MKRILYTVPFVLFFICLPGLFGWLAASLIWSKGGSLWLGILIIAAAASFPTVPYALLYRLGKRIERRREARVAEGRRIPAQLEYGRFALPIGSGIANVVILSVYASYVTHGAEPLYLYFYFIMGVLMLAAAFVLYVLFEEYPSARRLGKLRLGVTPVPLTPGRQVSWRIADPSSKAPRSGARVFLIYKSETGREDSKSSWEWRTSYEKELPAAESADCIEGEFTFPVTDNAPFVEEGRGGGWYLRLVTGIRWAHFPLPVEITTPGSGVTADESADEPDVE